MRITGSARWVGLLCAFVSIGVAAAGCSGQGASTSTPVIGTPAHSSASSPAPCFTVSLPAGWASQVSEHCGLVLQGPNDAQVAISVDTEPIDAATLKGLIAAKYSEVRVSEEEISGERVLVGTGAVPGALYIVVQALSATSGRDGYYAQGLTPEQDQIPEITGILASIRTTSG